MTEDSAGDCAGAWACDCTARGATGAPGVSTKVCPAEEIERVRRRTTAGNAILILVMANLPSPAEAWPCRVPSSYPQRYQKSSVKDSFSFRQTAPKGRPGPGRSRWAAGLDRTV